MGSIDMTGRCGASARKADMDLFEDDWRARPACAQTACGAIFQEQPGSFSRKCRRNRTE